jgi:DNA repair protein RadC
MKIQELPQQERPRERLLACGPEALSLPELLAILLTTGTQDKPVLVLAHELLAHFGGFSELLDATFEELRQIKGIGQAKAIQLQAAFALARRAAGPLGCAKAPIKSPVDAYSVMKGLLEEEKQEVLVVLLRDIKGRAFLCEKVSVGTLSSVLAHPREVFYPAVRHKAHSLILAHNHPSGDPTPSTADLHLTQQLNASGRIMGICLDDHLIVGAGSYVSLYERGILGDRRKTY